MDIPRQLCRAIGPMLSQRFLLASAKAQPRGGGVNVHTIDQECEIARLSQYCQDLVFYNYSATSQSGMQLDVDMTC